jgi:putative ABC transport system permease protein
MVALAVRTDTDPAASIDELRARIWAVDKDQPVSNIRTMDQVVARNVADRRLYAVLLGGFAVIALITATGGIYGLISYAAASRTQEMGIRAVLGATRGELVALLLRHGMLLILTGTIIGLAGSLVLTKTISGFLYGITATDIPTFVMVTLLFAAVGLIATYIPARRAATIDPIQAFRY